MNSGLFVVVEKIEEKPPYTPESFTVYAVRNDSSGYPHFLIYDNNTWIWVSAKRFRPKNALDY